MGEPFRFTSLEQKLSLSPAENEELCPALGCEMHADAGQQENRRAGARVCKSHCVQPEQGSSDMYEAAPVQQVGGAC